MKLGLFSLFCVIKKHQSAALLSTGESQKTMFIGLVKFLKECLQFFITRFLIIPPFREKAIIDTKEETPAAESFIISVRMKSVLKISI